MAYRVQTAPFSLSLSLSLCLLSCLFSATLFEAFILSFVRVRPFSPHPPFGLPIQESRSRPAWPPNFAGAAAVLVPPSCPFNSRRRRRRRIFCVLSVAVCRATPHPSPLRPALSLPLPPSLFLGDRAAAWAVLTLKILSSSSPAAAAASGRGERRPLSLSLSSCAFVRSFSPLSPIKKKRAQLDSSAVAVRTCNRE